MTSRNSRLIIAVAALVGLFAAYWFLVLGPKRDQIAKLDKDIAAKQTELTSARSTLAEYTKARDGYSDNYATLVRLGKAVPEQDDTRSLLVQLDSAAKSSGVDFRTMSVGGNSTGSSTTTGAATGPVVPGAVVGAAGFSVLPLTFSFRGSFFDMSQFFSRLERFVTVDNSKVNVTGRLVRVESVTVKPDQLGFPHLRAEIGASSYLVPSGQGVTGGATAAGPAAAGTTSAPSAGGSTPPTTTATVPGVTP